MLTTVKATVEGEHIEWQEDMDKMLPPNQRVDVLVTILQADSSEASVEERARRRVAALERLAARNPFASVAEPERWQRGARQDRELGERQ
jgi:hypothetical protein